MTPDGPSKPSRGGSASPHALLATCREHALDRLQAILDDALKGAADELTDIATRVTSPDTRKQYLHAVDQARTQGVKFRAGVAEAYRKRAATLSGENTRPAAAATAIDASSLTLVQTGVLENEIAIGNLTMRLKDKAGDELYQFTRRVSTIVGNPELLDADNPVGPSPLACGVYGGLGALGLHELAVRPLGTLVADRLAEGVGGLYHELNELLAGRGVAGAGKARIVKSRDTGVASKRDARGGQPPPPLPSGDVFAQLQVRLSQQRGLPAGQPGAGGGPGMLAGAAGQAGAPGGGAPVMATPATVDWLTQVQRGNEATAVPAIPATGESLNVLHTLRQSEIGQRFDPADATTCDIVAMMFDHVFSDPRIPEAIKPLIAQLQVPTLKAAMLDRAFFSDEAHPARRMLDRLGSAAIGWQGAADSSDPLYGAVERAVKNAVDGFGSDLSELEAATTEVEQLASFEEARTDALAQRSIDVLTRHERLVQAQETARDTVELRLREAVVPKPVRDLTERIYRAVLASAHENGGADSAAWTAALETLDNLLWSVKPKSGAEERARLVKTLPGLLKALDEGMQIAGFGDDERKEALDTLAPLHAEAVRGTSSQAIAPAAAPATPAEPEVPQAEEAAGSGDEPPALQSETLTGEDVVVETVELAPRSGRKAHGFRGALARFEKGTWVEFKQPDGSTLRARLSWVSPLKGMHVFVNPDTTRTLAFDPDALDETIARGDAEVLSAAPVVAEAMGYVMADLQEAGVAQ
jgi:Protein of unknown function (DUF1631)